MWYEKHTNKRKPGAPWLPSEVRITDWLTGVGHRDDFASNTEVDKLLEQISCALLEMRREVLRPNYEVNTANNKL